MTEFERYAEARAPALRRTAYLLCGDWARAEDLTQTTLVKLYLAWRRASRAENVDAYVRRMLVNSWIEENRRGRRGRETPVADLPEPPPARPHDTDLREALLDVLRRMPERQRACVVLRFWEDLSIAQVATLLDVTEGTVKSQTSRGLSTLRELADHLAPIGKDQS